MRQSDSLCVLAVKLCVLKVRADGHVWAVSLQQSLLSSVIFSFQTIFVIFSSILVHLTTAK